MMGKRNLESLENWLKNCSSQNTILHHLSLRKPKVFALQILQRYLTKEGRVRKFFHCLYG